jgi:hypothetical protein
MLAGLVLVGGALSDGAALTAVGLAGLSAVMAVWLVEGRKGREA